MRRVIDHSKDGAPVAITVRDLRFEPTSDCVRLWRAREPEAAALYNSLSALFPRGERFFIDSVRRHRGAADEGLAREIATFIRQEAIHTREHLAFNGQLAAAGYDPRPLDDRTRREIEGLQRRSPLAQLALTVALEHFTAVLAHALLADLRLMQAAPDPIARLWRWHAAEEIEHKAVAFDTLLAATPHWSGARRWAFRCALFVEAVARLVRVAGLNLAELQRQDGPGAFKLWPTLRHLLVSPGLVSAMAPALLGFLRPGFHPWGEDDSALAREAVEALSRHPARTDGLTLQGA